MENLDKGDRKLLYALDQNSRSSFEQLAELTNMPAETVRYRVKSLAERGIIFKFHGIVDTSLLGYSLYKIWLKLQLVSEEQIQELVDYLLLQKSISWLVRLDGDYDVCFVVCVTHVPDLHNYLLELMQRFSPHIAKRGMSINVRAHYLPRDYLVHDRRKSVKTRPFHAAREGREFDPLDLEILKLVSNNSRISASDIAQHIAETHPDHAISRVAVSARLKRLEQTKVINGYNVVLNHGAFGQLHYKLLVRMGQFTPQKANELYEHLKKLPQIVYLIETLGEWDFEVDLEVASVEEYREVLRSAFGPYSAIIRDFQALLIQKIWKYDVMSSI